jgi:hypothetical protein
MTTQIKIGARTYDSADYDIPAERTFRNAWSADETQGVIFVDMSKARDIWRDKIRAARLSELARLDAEFMRALETGTDTSAIVAQKQALRDATADPAIDAAQTPEQLKLVQPAGLRIE